MTKAELKKKMEDFIQSQDNRDRDEAYGTDRTFAISVLKEFAETINIELGVE
jgi:hypothetical protein